MAERWTQIRKLFREALELEPDQWEGFLQASCPEPEMREKVLAMLAAYDEDDTFLEKPAANLGPGMQDGMVTASTLVGTHVGPYKIKRSIARGGMGVVFEALDTRLDKVVALKMMSPALMQEPTFRQRFEQEARTLARLEDPHFVGVHALIDEGPNTFIVMEYVDGVTLAQHIQKKGALSGKDAIAVGAQLLQALSKAHRQNIIHRDLKPSNIMLTKNFEGRLLVKVLDFGIAKNIQSDSNQTRTVGAVGTLFYMSPEQARGLRTIDHRTDLYSLGVTLYEAVSGALPFDTATDEYTVRRQIVEGQFIPIQKRVPRIAPSLARVLNKALSTNPDDRYDDAAAMRTALLGALEEMRAVSEPQTHQPAEPAAPKKSPAMFVAATLLVVFVAAAFFIYSQMTESQPASASRMAEVPADSLNTEINEKASVIPIDSLTLLVREEENQEALAIPNTDASLTPTLETQPVERVSDAPEQAGIGSEPIDQEALTAEDTRNNDGANNLAEGNSTNENDISNPDSALSESEGNQALETNGPQPEGELSVFITPPSSVYVNDALLLENENVFNGDLPAGNNIIRVENATLGMWVCEMNIVPDKKQQVSIDFSSAMLITVTAEDASSGEPIPRQLPIYVNGKKSVYTTPAKMEIASGMHNLEIKEAGYEQVRINLDNSSGCFQSFGNYVNIDPGSSITGNPLVSIVLRQTN